MGWGVWHFITHNISEIQMAAKSARSWNFSKYFGHFQWEKIIFYQHAYFCLKMIFRPCYFYFIFHTLRVGQSLTLPFIWQQKMFAGGWKVTLVSVWIHFLTYRHTDTRLDTWQLPKNQIRTIFFSPDFGHFTF